MFSDSFPIAISWQRPQPPRESHVHDFHEIAIITNGVGVNVSKYAMWPVQTGDVIVIGGKQAHYFDAVHELEMVNILFQRERIALNVQDISVLDGFHALFGIANLRARHEFRSRFKLQPRDLAVILSYVEALGNEINSDQPAKGYFAHHYFMLVVGLLSRFYSEQDDVDANAALRIAKVINHLEANYTEEHHLTDLASIAGVSERTLQRLFRLATGQSPNNHLLQLRLNQAAAALRNPSRQITEIAYSVGFNDSNYFARQFKKRMGMTPREYQQMMALE